MQTDERVTDAMIEAAARAMCKQGSFNPDERMPNDGPRWKYYVDGARAALTAALSDEQTQAGVKAAIPTAYCCVCGRIVDTREKKDGGDDFGAETAPGKWACSIECEDVITGYAAPVRSAIVPAQDEAEKITDEVIAAICAAVVLGEGENYEPIHLEPREARQAIAAYHAALSHRTVSTSEEQGEGSAIISSGKD